METGYKHFSHVHNLFMHQMPEGAEISCSGCNSSGTGTIYVCWRCNFFLHEQCFRAARSMKHRSHPSHPLTLVPYPTYPSNSFYCNSCKIVGTGFSYSCSDCEFDLHVQCAYSISISTRIDQPFHSQTHTHQSFSPYNPRLEVAPAAFNGQHSYTVAENVAPVSVPVTAQYPVSSAEQSYMAQTAASSFVPNIAQSSYMAQNVGPISVPAAASAENPIPRAENPYPTHNVASLSVPNGEPANFDGSGQNGRKNQEIMHFGHPHGLTVVNMKDGEDSIACSACEETLVGKGYSCVKAKCNFHLHDSCFHLQREIQHESHPDHPLVLLLSAPYGNKNNEYTCNACYSDGTGFTYHCSVCKFDLHVTCVALPKTVKWSDHEHALKLLYSCPVKGEGYTFCCDVCHGLVKNDRWTYYCEACDYGTHLGCVDSEECPKTESSGDPVLQEQLNLQMLQLRMEMARQHAQLIANMGASISNLVG